MVSVLSDFKQNCKQTKHILEPVQGITYWKRGVSL